jgi:hypothetical protein
MPRPTNEDLLWDAIGAIEDSPTCETIDPDLVAALVDAAEAFAPRLLASERAATASRKPRRIASALGGTTAGVVYCGACGTEAKAGIGLAYTVRAAVRCPSCGATLYYPGGAEW